jgi:acyl-coenzyme A thioesterase PaaI-like protein
MSDKHRMQSWYLHEVEAPGAWGATRRIGAALRELTDRLVRVDASQQSSTATLEEVAAQLEAQVASLKALPAEDTRTAVRENTYLARSSQLMDRQPIIGLINPVAPPLVLSAEGDIAVGHANFGPRFEGMPGILHGGILSAAFDQMFGYVGMLHEQRAITGSLTVKYRKPTPLGVDVRFEATIERVDGRKSFRRSRCFVGGEVTAESEGLFVMIDGDWFQKLMQGDS